MAEAWSHRCPDIGRVETSSQAVYAEANLILKSPRVGPREDWQPLGIAIIPRSTAVMDLVYARESTPWIRAARARGNRAAPEAKFGHERRVGVGVRFESDAAVPAGRTGYPVDGLRRGHGTL